MDYNLLNGTTLAYIGDSIFETHIRKYLIDQGVTKINDLHKRCIKYSSAKGQSHIVDCILDNLLEEELLIYKRGRNASSATRKSATMIEYKKATGFEALCGYLYLTNNINRLEEIIKLSIKYIEEV